MAKDFQHPVLAALWDYWNRKRAGRAMPDRRDIDPAEIPSFVLPNIMMFDLIDGAARMRFRLIGTEVARRVGTDHTGLFLDEVLSGDYLDYVAGLGRELFERRAPLYAEAVFRWDLRRDVTTKRLMLPLTLGGPAPAVALVAQLFEATRLAELGRLSLSGVARFEIARQVLEEGSGE